MRNAPASSSTDAYVVGGTWQVYFRGMTSHKTLEATASAQDVYEALAGIPNSELRHINVNREVVEGSTYNYSAYQADNRRNSSVAIRGRSPSSTTSIPSLLLTVVTGNSLLVHYVHTGHSVPTNSATVRSRPGTTTPFHQ